MKTANKILLIAFGLLLVSIVSIMLIMRKELLKEPLAGSGQVITEARETLPFMDIEIIGKLEVYLQQGESLDIHVEADDNLLEFIDTSIEDNKLRIGLTSPVSTESPIIVNITLNDLSRLRASSNAAIVTSDQLIGRYLEIELSSGAQSTLDLNFEKVKIGLGSGAQATLYGEAHELLVESSTGSELDARYFKVANCDITTRSGSESKVYVTDFLKATARSGSRIYYRGEPSRREWFTSGSGTIEEEE